MVNRRSVEMAMLNLMTKYPNLDILLPILFISHRLVIAFNDGLFAPEQTLPCCAPPHISYISGFVMEFVWL